MPFRFIPGRTGEARRRYLSGRERGRAGRHQSVRQARGSSKATSKTSTARTAFIVVKDPEFPKLGNPSVGTQFELNDHRGIIVGIAKVASSGLFGVPTLYTTYKRALQYIPNPRFTISYVLVQPKSAADVAHIKQQVQALGYMALTQRRIREPHLRLSTCSRPASE